MSLFDVAKVRLFTDFANSCKQIFSECLPLGRGDASEWCEGPFRSLCRTCIKHPLEPDLSGSFSGAKIPPSYGAIVSQSLFMSLTASFC